MQHHNRTFIKSVLAIFIIVFVVAGFRWMAEDAEADNVQAEPQEPVTLTPLSVAPELKPAYPPVDAAAALIRELDSDIDMLNYNAEMRWPLASVTKLMTAVVAFEQLPADQIITMTQHAVGTEGFAGGFEAGGRYSVNDLVKAMMTVSSNDAAEALAEAHDERVLGRAQFDSALSKSAYFTAAMNEKASALGMTETIFGDATGLSMVSQSTAHDLQRLVRYIHQTYPGIFETTSHSETVITELGSGEKRTLKNINQFAGRRDFVGGKTGRTDESGDNLVSLFSYQGKTYVIVVFGAKDRFTETTKLYEWLKTNN